MCTVPSFMPSYTCHQLGATIQFNELLLFTCFENSPQVVSGCVCSTVLYFNTVLRRATTCVCSSEVSLGRRSWTGSNLDCRSQGWRQGQVQTEHDSKKTPC